MTVAFTPVCFVTEPVNKVSKKCKPSSQKGAFASIFKKANQSEMSERSPGRRKASAAAKVTAGNYTCALPGLMMQCHGCKVLDLR